MVYQLNKWYAWYNEDGLSTFFMPLDIDADSGTIEVLEFFKSAWDSTDKWVLNDSIFDITSNGLSDMEGEEAHKTMLVNSDHMRFMIKRMFEGLIDER